MTESELLRRLDRHLERADQHMKRGNEIMARSDRTMARSNEVIEEANELHRDHRQFIREITARQERVTQQLVEEIAANTRRIDAGTEQMTKQLQDLRLASNQHTQVLARMLDRLD